MASRKTARPGRTLAVFFLGIAIIYALVAVGGSWKPALGLDLRGGTQISMTAHASGGGSVSRDSLNDARDIIDNRVNGSGVTSAEVTTEGSNVIQVSIPGTGTIQRQLADRVRQTAKLRFRLVACDPNNGCSGASTSSTATVPQQAPTGAAPTTAPTGAANRAPFATAANKKGVDKKAADKKTAKKTAKKTGASTAPSTAPSAASPSASAAPASAAPASAAPESSSGDDNSVVPVNDALQFMRSVPSDWQQKFNQFTCPTAGDNPVNDAPSTPLLTCDASGQKYLLTPAIIEGTDISDANYGIPQNSTSYAVTLDFHSAGSSAFADATGAIAGTSELFAITLDGTVISAATADSRISGSAQITGNFTLDTAKSLATNLKYGSLPLDFPQSGISTQNVGPSLAGNQLHTGMWAGGIGLVLVMLYCLFYYRGLGLVVLSSLLVAGSLTFGLVLLLSKTAGFTLTLPGIAGLIVAVGITADSFIIFFERIRDEMRDGKSMRVAVESGWVRARRTRVASSTVSLLSAVVLYIFATGDVKGFGFALGLSTLVDLAVIFWFTKPIMSTLAKLRFFNSGGMLSGLSREAVGVGLSSRTSTAGGSVR